MPWSLATNLHKHLGVYTNLIKWCQKYISAAKINLDLFHSNRKLSSAKFMFLALPGVELSFVFKAKTFLNIFRPMPQSHLATVVDLSSISTVKQLVRKYALSYVYNLSRASARIPSSEGWVPFDFQEGKQRP